ncbi:MAG: hypothetical protein RRC34_04790 [Lentisphaeria bacterium]|nr:hypothetical protein [Lentisphaeria bacterium]
MIKRLLIPIATVSALVCLSAFGESARIEHVTVTHLPVQGATFHGYRSFQFDVSNQSKEKTADVTIALMSYNNSSISKTVRLEPSSHSQVILYQPDMGNKPVHNAMINVKGVDTTQMYIGGNMQHGSSHRSSDQICMLFSKNYKTEGFTDAAAKAIDPSRFGGGGSSGHYSHQKPVTAIRAETPVDTWIPDWLAYSPYDAVAISLTEYDGIRQNPMGKALNDYTLAGGTLHIFGASEDTASVIGFGRRVLHTAAAPVDLTPNAMKALYGDLKTYARFWCEKENTVNLHRYFPILADLKLPFRPFLISMFIFAILMGPVAVFILAKANRRIWLLWIIPLFSGCTAAFVYIFSIASEGSESTTLARGMAFLDQPSKTSVAVNRVAYYSPRRIKALRYPTHTEVSFQNQDWSYSGRGNLTWANEQLLTDGWMQSRIPAYFQTRSVAPLRERVKLIRENDKLYVLNGLSVDLTLFRVNVDGETWQAPFPVLAGQRTELNHVGAIRRPSPGDTQPGVASMRHIFSFQRDIVPKMDTMKQTMETATMLPTNVYCAVTATPYLVHNGLDPEKAIDGYTLLYGLLD